MAQPSKELYSLEARLCGVPPKTTAQQKGALVVPSTGRIRFYQKASVREAQRTWWEILRPAKDALPAPFDGPISVLVALFFPHLASTPKRDQPKTVPLGRRPDLDNVVKSLLDTMTAMGFWRDDGQIYHLIISKWRGPEPGVVLDIRPHNPGNRPYTPIKVNA